MGKSDLKTILARKLAENSKRHAEASQEVDFDYGRQHVKLPVDLIDPNPYQPRQVFPAEEIESLASSIAESGLIQPIVVRPSADSRYQIIAGERRWRAHKLLGRQTIESLVSPAEDSDMAVLALAENIDREDLSDYEIGKALRNVENMFPSKKRLAEALGLNREDMYRYFAFESLPATIRVRLDSQPRILARAAAAEIKRILQQAEKPALAEQALAEAWALLESGQLEQTKIPAFMLREMSTHLPGKGIRGKETTPLMRAGKKIGVLSRDASTFALRFKTGALTARQEERLLKLVEEFTQE